jgi:hypothetical protein
MSQQIHLLWDLFFKTIEFDIGSARNRLRQHTLTQNGPMCGFYSHSSWDARGILICWSAFGSLDGGDGLGKSGKL